MKVIYKNKIFEKFARIATFIIAVIVAATFVLLYGFDKPLLPARLLHAIQVAAFMAFIAEKAFRYLNTFSRKAFLRANWIEIPLLIIFIVVITAAEKLFPDVSPKNVKNASLRTWLRKWVMSCDSYKTTRMPLAF